MFMFFVLFCENFLPIAVFIPFLYRTPFFIVKMKELRPAIIRMHERGIAKHEIARLLDVPRATVQYDIQRFEETGSNIDRKGRGAKKTARSRRNIQRAKKMVQ